MITHVKFIMTASLLLIIFGYILWQDNYNDLNAFYSPEYVIPDEEDFTGKAALGRDIISHTAHYLGSNSERYDEKGKPYITLNMNCTKCHIQYGTAPNRLPLIVSYAKYNSTFLMGGSYGVKKYTIESQINSCITQYMDGSPLPTKAAEMVAIVSYLNKLSSGIQSPYIWIDVKGIGNSISYNNIN